MDDESEFPDAMEVVEPPLENLVSSNPDDSDTEMEDSLSSKPELETIPPDSAYAPDRRYFDEPKEDDRKCYSCGESGHLARDCLKPSNYVCFNCGEPGHIKKYCPKDQILICFKCGETGHAGFRCPNTICSFCLGNHAVHECEQLARDKKEFMLCFRCGATDHFLNQCEMPMPHRIAKMRCFVCGEESHLNCKGIKAMESVTRPPKQVQLCSNCGDQGHTVYFCPLAPMDNSLIARGMSTRISEPDMCYYCLGPGHGIENCPLKQRRKAAAMVRQQRRRNSKYVYRAESATPPPVKRKRSVIGKHGTQSLKKLKELNQAVDKWSQQHELMISAFTKKKRRVDRRKRQNHKKSIKNLSRKVVYDMRRQRKQKHGKSNRKPHGNSNGKSNGKSKRKRGKALSGCGIHTMKNTGTRLDPSWNRHYDNW